MEIDSVDLRKIEDVLKRSSVFFRRRDEMNAEVHLAREVRYSPLTVSVDTELERVQKILRGVV